MDASTPKGARRPPPGKHARSSAQSSGRPRRIGHDGFVREIEDSIVPRLVLAHRGRATSAARKRDATHLISESDVSEFATIVSSEEFPVALKFVESVRSRGVPLETIYLELLAPTARRLGEWWTADLCDFTAVTLGLWRLQQVAREYSPVFRRDAALPLLERRALLASVPGEQHTFGVAIVAEFLRRAGWNVTTEMSTDLDTLVGRVRNESFSVLGLSLSCASRLEGLASIIHVLRRVSRNRSIGIMVGGPVFAEHPELAALVGADATAVDGRTACDQASSLVALLASRARKPIETEIALSEQALQIIRGRTSLS